MDIEKDDCLRRAFGRRIDPENGELFHLDESPPPIDNSAKVERLEIYDDPFNSEVIVVISKQLLVEYYG